jgi:hypothetical protein
MATITEIRNALYAWVSGQTSLTVIWRFANAPQPARPYVTLRMLPLADVGYDWHGDPDAQGDAETFKDRVFAAEIEVHGEAQPYGANVALSELEQIKRSLQMVTVTDILSAAGLAPMDTSPSEERSAIRRLDFEARYAFQARFGVTQEGTESVGYIATSDAPTGTYES